MSHVVRQRNNDRVRLHGGARAARHNGDAVAQSDALRAET